jgi:proteasome activator subunit 4
MVPVMTSFLPPTHTHVYLPVLFKLWEAFNSSVIDERLLELCGDLSEEHVGGLAGDATQEGNAKWQDVGIWTKDQWTLLTGKALGAMSMFSEEKTFIDSNKLILFIRYSCWLYECK